mmetsp:Transcript_15609/g.43656  ORF Transcript_15609/g.43656 Transcript_15609/m.43656 type:complete len:214 (+) Transcript_15609:605-1246(+)
MAARRMTYSRAPNQRVPSRASILRLAPARAKKGRLVMGITAPRIWCRYSFSRSALLWPRLVAMRPITTQASSGSALRRSASRKRVAVWMMMTVPCSFRAMAGPSMPCKRPLLGRSTIPSSAAPPTPMVRLASRLSTGSINPTSVREADSSLLNTILATSMLRANATITTTSFTTTTAITRLVKGPRASISLRTAMAEAGLLAIMRQPAREQKA